MNIWARMLALFVFAAGSVVAVSHAAALEYSPSLSNNFPTRVFWGDTHLHSNESLDAFSGGNYSVTPEQAYSFARGETVISQSGVRARLDRPLDFLMVSDHAEFLGVMTGAAGQAPALLASSIGQRYRNYLDHGGINNAFLEFALQMMGLARHPDPESLIDPKLGITREILAALQDPHAPEAFRRSVWSRIAGTADAFNEPGRFTAFIGYEWTSTPGGNNLHRNVLFRDGAERAARLPPFSGLDSLDPQQLWRHLARYERETGGQVLAIPHNSNLSNGLMFAPTTLQGEPIDADYSAERARWEPVIEVTQIKGDSEAHPLLSPNDEFADYENWDRGNLFLTASKQPQMLRYEYARAALGVGLELENKLGQNPYRFGMIGSTDSHNSLSAVDEDNYFGKMTNTLPRPGRSDDLFSPSPNEADPNLPRAWEGAASGYAAIWARENTREALFDAIKRREVYATTGPRITVRFFGGHDFAADEVHRSDFAAIGYRRGVPMGGTLVAGDKRPPRFMVSALADPDGANLDRIQIIKGWLGPDGRSQEHIYNVAASDGRVIRHNKVAPLHHSVDLKSATYSNAIGNTALATVWEDPDFDADQAAFYYVRVLEIPTPRWTSVDAAVFGETSPAQAPTLNQDRAYTSPIWYTP